MPFKVSISFFFLLFSLHTLGQESLRLGEWESHLPYQSGKWVTQSDNNIIYATDLSLLLINKEDRSSRFISKVEGLSDTGIKLLAYDNFNDQLIVIYTNSNIDIITDNGITNVSDIKDNTSILGSKEITDIHIANGQQIFLTTAFGMVEYRSDKLEFGSTIFTNLPVNGVTTLGSKLYMATEDGLYFIDTGSVSNIADFNQWELLGSAEGLPVLYEADHTVTFQDIVYFSEDGNLYASGPENMFSLVYEVDDTSFSIEYLSSGSSVLMVGLRETRASRIVYFNGNEYFEGNNACIDRLLYSIEDEEGRIWYADNFREFRVTDNPNGGCEKLSFNSPLKETASEIAVGNGSIIIASGGVTDNYQDLFGRDGVYLFQDGKWENINEGNYAAMQENDMLSFFRVTYSPDRKKVNLGSFWNGILEYDLETKESIFYSKNNTTLQGAIGDGRTRISDMEYDAQDRLWISNFGAPRPLVMKDEEGNWFSFRTNQDTRLGDLVIDQVGNVWVVTFGSSGGLYIFNPGEDLNSTFDDERKIINLNNSAISTSIIYTVEVDLEGDIWVGTGEGAVVFEGGGNVFDGNCEGLRKRVTIDGIDGLLLETEEVKTIAFDGGNRKWFGTRNGIFVQNADGDVEIARYNVDNSPLFDNEIVDLEYDGVSGIMYISTNKGVQALRTTTTRAKKTHDNLVYAFPNPATPDYNGPIAIKGLARDAIVKITDLSGRVVFETKAEGGQAIWNGNDLSGNRAETGVYLVFSTGEAGFGVPDSYVTKILFISE